jgi:hypothetical protein
VDPFWTVVAVAMGEQDHRTFPRRCIPRRKSDAVSGNQVYGFVWDVVFSKRIPGRDDAPRMEGVVHFGKTEQNRQEGQRNDHFDGKI